MKLDLSEWHVQELILDKETNTLKIVADNDSLEILLPQKAFDALIAPSE